MFINEFQLSCLISILIKTKLFNETSLLVQGSQHETWLKISDKNKNWSN